jgi:basic membrane protein A and related proteins
MNSKFFRVLFVISTIFILVAMSACQPAAPAAEEPAAEAPAAEEAAAEEPMEEPMEEHVKAVVLLEGPLADTGWNTSCWEAMQAMEAEYGWEVSYQDNVNTDNMVDLLRGYGQQDFDIVFGPGWLWAEPMTEIAPEFPDTTWVNINQNISGPDNLVSNGWVTGESGYFLGILAAQMTQTKKIGYIGGTESPLISYEYEMMKKVAQEFDPEIEVTISYVGSWADAAKAKELALANIEGGADIILSVSGGGDLGVFEAVQENEGTMFIGWTGDQCSFVPDQTIASMVELPGFLLKLAAVDFENGALQAGYTPYSITDGAHDIAWCGDNVPDDVVKMVEDAIEQFKNGELEIETTTDI